MGKLEDYLAQAYEKGEIPHAVIAATNADGSFTYQHAVGSYTLDGTKPIEQDALFALASSTKLFTTVAALQIVDRGLFGLDEDVTTKLPELADLPIITAFDGDDKPVYEKRKGKVTLRHLLTHSSGLAYYQMSPLLTKLAEPRIPITNGTVFERFCDPLAFEPGTAWLYGPGMDFAGKLVERLTDLTLEEYIHKHICEPLGITTFTFFPPGKDTPVPGGKIPQMAHRGPEGKLIHNPDRWMTLGAVDCFGGHGGYCSTSDYLKVQRSLLANDGKLLKPETVDAMFRPQLSPESEAALMNFWTRAGFAVLPGENDASVPVSWGTGSMLFMKDGAGRRKKGTLNWGGMANTYWIIDREADLALTIGTQVLPTGDKGTSKMIEAVELGVYEMAGVKF